jgi:hypothetical protein
MKRDGEYNAGAVSKGDRIDPPRPRFPREGGERKLWGPKSGISDREYDEIGRVLEAKESRGRALGVLSRT